MRLFYFLALVAIKGSLSVVRASPPLWRPQFDSAQQALSLEHSITNSNPSLPLGWQPISIRNSRGRSRAQHPRPGPPRPRRLLPPVKGDDPFIGLLTPFPNLPVRCPHDTMKQMPGKFTAEECMNRPTDTAWVYVKPDGGTYCISSRKLQMLSQFETQKFNAFGQRNPCYEPKIETLEMLKMTQGIEAGNPGPYKGLHVYTY